MAKQSYFRSLSGVLLHIDPEERSKVREDSGTTSALYEPESDPNKNVVPAEPRLYLIN